MEFEAFYRQYGLKLDPQQQAAVRTTEGPVLLLAVPGSGKTTALVARIGCLLYCRQVPPQSILTMTYTVAATADMRRRFAAQFGEEDARKLEFRTINGVCAKIIQHYEQLTGRRAFDLIAEEGERSRVLREVYAACGLGYPTESDLDDCKTRIAFCKNSMLSDSAIQEMDGEDGHLFAVFDAYRKALQQNRKMDYDDQLIYARKILQACPQLLEKWQARYRYFLVDEAQDTSRIQHEIIALLAKKTRNLFMVGDEDQSIYGFRAACPQALREFGQNWPEASVLLMETNYRSTGNIVRRADALIQRNRQRHTKHMRTDNPPGAPILLTPVRHRWRQYEYLARMASSCTEQTAVLYRNHESVLPLIDLLEKRGIPYDCREQKDHFFTHNVVRDICSILRFAQRPEDGTLFLEIYYKFNCGISREMAQAAVREGRKRPDRALLDILAQNAGNDWRGRRLAELADQARLLQSDESFSALQRISRQMGYLDYLHSRKMDEGKLDTLQALAYQNKDILQFLQRLEQLAALAAVGRKAGGTGLVLSTIHASKGMEFERVVLIDAIDGVLPAAADGTAEEQLLQEEEERRLFYVGVTRAKKHLEILQYAGITASFVRELMQEKPRAQTHAAPKPGRQAAPRPDPAAFQPGKAVVHKFFGAGIIERGENQILSVRFQDGSLRRLELRACLNSGILHLQ